MTLVFDQPAALWLIAIAVPIMASGWFLLRGSDRFRRGVVLLARTLLIAGIAIAIAGPSLRREHHDVTVIGLVDVSGSVRAFGRTPLATERRRQATLAYLRDWLRQAATNARSETDRFGLVVFDGQAMAIAAPTAGDYTDDLLDITVRSGTSIEDAIRMGLALFPADSARRLVLVSDGNETTGDALAAVRDAAHGQRTPEGDAVSIPIDVLTIPYGLVRDVQITRVDAPPTARPGQTVIVRIELRATHATRGRLYLRREGRAIDLNGDDPGTDRLIDVPAGDSLVTAHVVLGDTPVNRFAALFEPEVADDDALAANNAAETVTATPGKGRTLIVTVGGSTPGFVTSVLEQAGLRLEVRTPDALPRDLLGYQNFDLLVLDNVPATAVPDYQQELIARHVDSFGAGLLMVGGDSSFGAGGWKGTPIADVLPLELDPPKELILPQAALVLVLDRSGSMERSVAGARASQQEVANRAAAAAIDSLRGDALVGVISFSESARVVVPLQPNTDRAAIGEKIMSIRPDGGTNIAAGLKAALEMLRNRDVDRKRVVCLTDGQARADELEAIAARMRAQGIVLSTIGVGDDADFELLGNLAEIGGGEFYPVYNARALPRVLVDSVQIVNKPLIKESLFVPVVHPTGSTLTAGMTAAPQLGGLVVTAPRADAQATIEMSHPDGEPLLAHWQAGLGRVAAFTSDAGGPWSRNWTEWGPAAALWVQIARMLQRPTFDPESELLVEARGDTLYIALEATGGVTTASESGFLDYLDVPGRVYPPEGDPIPIRLEQTAPGQYATTIPAPSAGNYVVALSPRSGRRLLPPVIGAATRSTGEEFRRYEPDGALLDRIAELTGGRRLDLADPDASALFDRSDLPRTVSLRPVATFVIVFALALFILDVAARRIAWSSEGLRLVFARLLSRTHRADHRGEAVLDTLAGLRTGRSNAPGPPRAEPARRQEKPKASRRPGATPRPTATEAASVIRSLFGRPGTERPHGEAAPPEETASRFEPSAEPEPAPDAESNAESDEVDDASATTSSLLAAKRARERYKDD